MANESPQNTEQSPPRLIGVGKGHVPERVARELIDFGASVVGLGAWEYDFDRHEVYWTQGVFDIFDLEADDPPLYDEAIRYYTPESRKRIGEGIRAAIEDGTETDVVCRILSAKNRNKFVRVVIRPNDDKRRQVSRLKGIVQDVTNRELLQRGMETFFEMTPDLVGALDVNGKPLNLSPSWESVLGWSPKEIRKRGVLGLVHESEREQMSILMREVLNAQVIHHVETRLRTAEGDFRWLSWRLFGDNASETIFVAARDTTRRKQNEAALMEAKRQAEEASMAKSNFLAVMSHELRTPLNPILGFTDLLIHETDNPEHREILTAISEAGQNLTKVIGDVLDFAKIESGRTEIHEEEFDLEKVLDAKVRLMRGQLGRDAVELTFRFDYAERAYPPNARFVGDSEKISRVLTNLISNSIKFTSAGGIEVRASVEPADKAALLRVEVEDSGDGIPSDKLETIFEPFVQADSSITRQYGGSGLGLSICRKLVELMGGTISARSEPGEGSTFSFSVPLRPAKAPERKPATGFEMKAWAEELKAKGPPHVLMVEDNATNVYYAKRILESFHCEVTAVSSGEEALAEYSAGTHDLILLDLHMPGIGGMEVLRSIRKSEASLGWQRVPILVLTANVLKTTKDECLENGADAVLNKPIRVQGMAEALAAHF